MKKRISLVLGSGMLVAGLALGAAAADEPDESASPDASAATPDASSQIEWLFVQNAASGSLGAADDGTYQLMLSGVDADTIAFSDTPYREVKSLATSEVVDIINDATDKPNAALQLISPEGTTIVLTLDSATYDADADELTYAAELLADGSLGDIAPEGDLPADEFEAPTLFIDGEAINEGQFTFEPGSQCQLAEDQIRCWLAKKGGTNWPPIYSSIKVTFKVADDSPAAVQWGWGFLCTTGKDWQPGQSTTLHFHHSVPICATASGNAGPGATAILEIVSIEDGS